MARVAGGLIVNGLDTLTTVAQIGGMFSNQLVTLAISLEDAIFTIQKEIFYDLAWQMEAYLYGGLHEMQLLNANGTLDNTTFGYWQDVDAGFNDSGDLYLQTGTLGLLKREQTIAVLPGYAIIDKLPAHASVWLSLAADNPYTIYADYYVPGEEGLSFNAYLSGGSITDVTSRWNWVSQQVFSVWWGCFDADPEIERTAIIEQPLVQLEGNYPPLPNF